MASFNTVDYSNSRDDEIYKLNEIVRDYEQDFPIVVNILPPDYEVMFGNYLPFNENVLLVKPKVVEYVRVKIVPFFNVDEITKAKGSEFVEARNKYNGKEFLLPLKYPGKLQIVNKHGRRNRYTSVSQVIDDLPHYIKVCQETPCKSPVDGSVQTITSGAILELERVITLEEENKRCIEYTSSDDESFILTEGCPFNGKSLHTLTTIVEENEALPKIAIFDEIDPYDILLWDDDEASDMLLLMDGPISVQSVSSCEVLIAWLKADDLCEKRKLALIPEKSWPTINLELSHFSNEADKNKYIEKYFDCYHRSEFIQSSLYKIIAHENDVVFLSEPREDDTDYEKPISMQNLRECVPERPPSPAKVHVVEEKEKSEEILLPTVVKSTKETRLGKLKESVGLRKTNNPSHKHTDTSKTRKHTRSDTHELVVLPSHSYQNEHFTNRTDLQHSGTNTQQTGPSFPIHFQSSTGTKPKQAVRPIQSSPTVQRKDMQCKTNTLMKLVDFNKISRPNQTKEDFYSYTLDEVVECFKLCGLDTLATKCSVHNIDGAFFRNISESDLQTHFNVNGIDSFKVIKAIEGWRARLGNP